MLLICVGMDPHSEADAAIMKAVRAMDDVNVMALDEMTR